LKSKYQKSYRSNSRLKKRGRHLDLIKAGRENASAALVKAIQLVFEDRVFVFNNKTVVFE
jgi:formyltetrahydrofolate hydrolase